MCAAIIAYIPFIIVINKNILNRRPLMWSMTIQPVVAVYVLNPVNDNIDSKMRAKKYR